MSLNWVALRRSILRGIGPCKAQEILRFAKHFGDPVGADGVCK